MLTREDLARLRKSESIEDAIWNGLIEENLNEGYATNLYFNRSMFSDVSDINEELKRLKEKFQEYDIELYWIIDDRGGLIHMGLAWA